MTQTTLTDAREIALKHGITDEEFRKICAVLGREPNLTEIGIYSVMWSEHCSYKNSRPILRKFPTEGENLLVRAGEENAGAIDIGDGLAVVFKIESHNHPSAIEPFQGAATGVGGIIRDIFTMGARPVLLMNSLRFGSLDHAKNRHYLHGVVAGIAHYGNCIGIPTAGGEIYFDDAYEGNPLVNAFCLGIMKHTDLVKAKAKGAGNPVFYVGASTGRDGLGGAAFASRELTEESKADRPAVQVGDPFMEKLLLEACLEVIKTGAVIGMQDMGAAGLTCSTCETAARGSTGIRIDLTKVPLRETGMIPYEIMLSESQERMLVIVQKGKEKIVEDVFTKWDLHAKKIGEVTSGNMMKVFSGGELAAEIPAKSLTDEAPIYERDYVRPYDLAELQDLDMRSIECPKDLNGTLLQLLSSPTISSKEWIYEQYDHMVKTDTVFLPGHDAALIRIKGTKKGLAVSTDCNGLYCYLDPHEGGKIAVAEAARNVVCSGAKPLGISNCLNFGNPMKPDVFWYFRECTSGMSEACRAFETPVTGGNVSFYNESPKGAVYPTPVVAMVGLLNDIDKRIPSFFQKAGDLIYIFGDTFEEIGGSQYLLQIHGAKRGLPPRLTLSTEKKLHQLILSLAEDRLLASCHDMSEGGFGVALAECLFGRRNHPLGAAITELDHLTGTRPDIALFSESQSRVIASSNSRVRNEIVSRARQIGVSCYVIGKVTQSSLQIGSWIDISSTVLEKKFRHAISKRMETISDER